MTLFSSFKSGTQGGGLELSSTNQTEGAGFLVPMSSGYLDDNGPRFQVLLPRFGSWDLAQCFIACFIAPSLGFIAIIAHRKNMLPELERTGSRKHGQRSRIIASFHPAAARGAQILGVVLLPPYIFRPRAVSTKDRGARRRNRRA